MTLIWPCLGLVILAALCIPSLHWTGFQSRIRINEKGLVCQRPGFSTSYQFDWDSVEAWRILEDEGFLFLQFDFRFGVHPNGRRSIRPFDVETPGFLRFVDELRKLAGEKESEKEQSDRILKKFDADHNRYHLILLLACAFILPIVMYFFA